MQKEVEVKIKVDDATSIEKLLQVAGCVLGEAVAQKDTIYINYNRPFNEFIAGDIFLRLRNQNGNTLFTFKQGEELNSTEYETEVADPSQMNAILLALGFRPEVVVEKKRRKGRWNEYEVYLDEVKGLGSYLELEKISDEIASEVQEKMLNDLASIGIDSKERVFNGYDTLVWMKDNI